MSQLKLNLFEGKAELDRGIDQVSVRGEDFLARMRRVAAFVAYTRGFVTSDDLRAYADQHGIEPHHPNCWGAVFRATPKKGWKWVEDGWTTSRLVSNHARKIRIWKIEKDR